MDQSVRSQFTADVLDEAEGLALCDDDLARILRCSVETIRLYRAGKEFVDASVHREMAGEFLDACHRIRAVLRPDECAEMWVRTHNEELDACPLDLMRRERGVVMLNACLRYGMGDDAAPIAADEDETSSREASPVEPPFVEPPPRPQGSPPRKAASGWWAKVAGGAALVAGVAGTAAVWLLRHRR